MTKQELLKALHWPLWFVIMTLVMGFLGRPRLQARGDQEDIMCMPRRILIAMVMCLTLFVAIAILSQLFPGADGHGGRLKEPNPYIAVFFMGFALLCLPVIICYFIERHQVTPDNLIYRTLTKKGVLAWRDVVKLRYSPTFKWFRLEDKEGNIVRVSIALTGLPFFARTAIVKIPSSAMDEETKAIMAATALDSPPSLWI